MLLQPRPSCWQHHSFFATDQPCCQLSSPATQSKGADGVVVAVAVVVVVSGQPRKRWKQHHFFLLADHPFLQLLKPARQSYGVEVPVVDGLSQPKPSWAQHQAFLAGDQTLFRTS